VARVSWEVLRVGLAEESLAFAASPSPAHPYPYTPFPLSPTYHLSPFPLRFFPNSIRS
jgi:hypothetical protein